MKVLIADDELIARKVLASFLEKTGHEVVSAPDGQEALRMLEAPDAPPIAILDIMMPVMNGREVCSRLRRDSRVIRPYIILLSARAEKQEVAAGLDAGADDYLAKPFHPVELLARLRVAQRAINYQLELQNSIRDLRLLLNRYQMLGEMAAKSPIGASGEGIIPGVPILTIVPSGVSFLPDPPMPSLPEPNRENSDPIEEGRHDGPRLRLSGAEMDQLIIRALSHLRFGHTAVTLAPASAESVGTAFCAWTALALVREGIWLDLVMELDAVSAKVLFERVLRRRCSSDREMCDAFAEALNIVGSTIKSALVAKDSDVIMPFLSQAGRTDGVSGQPPLPAFRDIHRFAFHEASLSISILLTANPVRQKTPGQLCVGEVLAEPFQSPQLEGVVLLNKGVVLNDLFIEKLGTLSQTEPDSGRICLRILQPTSLAHFFCGHRPGQTFVA